MLRDPNEFVMPILLRTLGERNRRKEARRAGFPRPRLHELLDPDPVIKILEQGARRGGQITVLYRKSLKWQDISFSALVIFQTPDGRIVIEGDGVDRAWTQQPPVYKGWLTLAAQKITVQARYASRYSLWVELETASRRERRWRTCTLRVEDKLVQIGPCRIAPRPADGGLARRLVAVSRIHDFEKLFFHAKVDTLESAVAQPLPGPGVQEQHRSRPSATTSPTSPTT